jgi:tRNA (cmo5U34)-methyltransferase
MTNNSEIPAWNEAISQAFIDYGRYFVPDRQTQIETLCSLIPIEPAPLQVLELCCGEGMLAEAILERLPRARLSGLDGSPEMLRRAGQRLARFGERFQSRLFDLASSEWRQPDGVYQAILSSLAIHHLDGPAKQRLYQDLYRMLSPGGVLLVADIIQPVSATGLENAAQAWDESVRQQALAFDGHLGAFEFFEREGWNTYRHPDPMDMPSGLYEQLGWLSQAGFAGVDVYWLKAGHAVYGGQKP